MAMSTVLVSGPRVAVSSAACCGGERATEEVALTALSRATTEAGCCRALLALDVRAAARFPAAVARAAPVAPAAAAGAHEGVVAAWSAALGARAAPARRVRLGGCCGAAVTLGSRPGLLEVESARGCCGWSRTALAARDVAYYSTRSGPFGHLSLGLADGTTLTVAASAPPAEARELLEAALLGRAPLGGAPAAFDSGCGCARARVVADADFVRVTETGCCAAEAVVARTADVPWVFSRRAGCCAAPLGALARAAPAAALLVSLVLSMSNSGALARAAAASPAALALLARGGGLAAPGAALAAAFALWRVLSALCACAPHTLVAVGLPGAPRAGLARALADRSLLARGVAARDNLARTAAADFAAALHRHMDAAAGAAKGGRGGGGGGGGGGSGAGAADAAPRARAASVAAGRPKTE